MRMANEAHSLITEAVTIAQAQGLTKAEWCRRAGFDEFGKVICNATKRGDIKLEAFSKLLEALGYEIIIAKKDLEDEMNVNY